MVGFTKLHGAIIHSSIWSEPHYVRIVWVTMLAMCDANGMVEASASGLARAANVTRDECNDAVANLSGPDPDSRDGTTGERIERVAGGFQVLNYANYRDRQTREQSLAADRAKRLRDGRAPVATDVSVGRGYVYYAADATGLVKIGYSKNPWARVSELRTANPRIEIIANERGDMELEKQRHTEFSDLREEGEWFRMGGALAKHVEELLRVATKGNRSSDVTRVTTEAEAEAEADKNTQQSAGKPRARAVARPDDVPEQAWKDWQAVRKAKRAGPITETVMTRMRSEAVKAKLTLAAAVEESAARGWQAFKADWMKSAFAKPEGKSHATHAVRHNTSVEFGDPSCLCGTCKTWRAEGRASA